MPKKQTKTKKPKSKKTKGKSTKSKSINQHVNVNVHSSGGSGGGGSSMPQPQQQQQQYIPQQVQQNMPSAFGDRRGEDVKLNNILKLVEQQGLKLGEMQQQQQEVNRFDFLIS